MTPLYLDSQEAVDAHNERVKVQREAFAEGINTSIFVSAEEAQERAEEKYPLAQLRPSGFVCGDGMQYRYDASTLFLERGLGSDLMKPELYVPLSDRAAASVALTGGVWVWAKALYNVADRHNVHMIEAAGQYGPEIITEAQALLDREGGK